MYGDRSIMMKGNTPMTQQCHWGGGYGICDWSSERSSQARAKSPARPHPNVSFASGVSGPAVGNPTAVVAASAAGTPLEGEGELPAGWETAMSRSKHAPYYINMVRAACYRARPLLQAEIPCTTCRRQRARHNGNFLSPPASCQRNERPRLPPLKRRGKGRATAKGVS